MVEQETLEEIYRLKTAPPGYRLVPTEEFRRRYRRCAKLDRWRDLDRVTLYDPSLKQHLDISCIHYIWRGYVEKLPQVARLRAKGASNG